MKPTVNLAALALVVAVLAMPGCVPDNSGIEINAAYDEIDANCVATAGGMVEKGGGYLDIDWTSRYFLALRVINNLDSSPVPVGSESIPSARNDFFLHEMELTYSCKDTRDRCAGFPKYGPVVVQISGTVLAHNSLDMPLDVMTYDLTQKLLDFSPIVDDGLTVTMLVSIRLRGAFNAGGGNFQTTPFVFPIQLYADPNNLPPTCAPGESLQDPKTSGVKPAPCHNFGQDGSIGVCASLTGT